MAVAGIFASRLSRRSRTVPKQPDVSLPSSSSLYESLINQLPMGVTVFDSRGLILFKNRTAKGMSGTRYIDALVDDAVERLAEQAALRGDSEFQLSLTGPPERHYALSASRMESGEIAVFASDVTAKDRLESMRRDFVANLSHELKTPLGGMAALSDSMVGEFDQAVIARLAERVASEAQRMSAVIDDLLDLSRIESRADIFFESVDVAAVINEAISLQRLNSEKAGVEIRADVPRIDPIRVDRTQMLSAISNLIENAIKYSDSGDSVTISLTNGDAVRITISDEGIGIAQDDLERIFERFYRVDRGRSRATGGTGLGLAIAKHAVENNGGVITVSSVEGEGSTFVVTLPRGGVK